ncbi:hypothetical protein [Leptospira interrogans]|uniref:hypothetical protein n=1 Tax=Leptospira interrogans TaxID=173 RepID=UPI00046C6E1D|nr:hypothetical protein [Leptospira interrogans]
MIIAKNQRGKFVAKFRDIKDRLCAVTEADAVGNEQTVWCGIECADRMRLTRTQAGYLSLQLQKFSETGSLE